MTSKNLQTVIQRAISDAAFRRLLQSNPEAALRGFKLTSDEVAALRSGDAGKLMSLGIDQRMSKTFTVGGEATLNAASRSVTGTELGLGGAALTDQGVARLSNAEIDPGSIGDPIRTADDANATRDALEDQSIANAQSRVNPGTQGTVRSQVRDIEPAAQLLVTSEQTAARDALEDDSIANAQSRFASNADATVRSAVRDVEPASSISGSVAPVEGSPEASAFDATSDATARSAIRDVEPAASISGNVAPTEGSPEAFAFRDATTDTIRSAVRDVEPTDLSSQVGYGENYPAHGGLAGESQANVSRMPGVDEAGYSAARAGAVDEASADALSRADAADDAARTSFSGDDLAGPGYLAADATGSVSRIRDSEPVDIGGTKAAATDAGATSSSEALSAENYAPEFSSLGSTDTVSRDAIEDMSHSAAQNAFLSSQEAAQYAGTTESVDSAGNVIDPGHVTPEITSSDDTGVDATVNPDDPQITS